MIEKYDIEYMGVKCTGVEWERDVFYFTKDRQNYTYMQTEYISSSADTDHIRCVIEEQFLPWWKDQRIKELEAENEELKREIMKEQTISVWAKKDAGMFYDENARLKEKMQKMIELKEPDIELNPYTGDWELRYQEVVTKVKVYDERSEAEARLAELKAKK